MIDRAAAKIDFADNGCWLWTAQTDKDGYGRATDGSKRKRAAHRVLYEELVGPIPDGLQLDHLCKTPSCVNPDHLEPVTPRENTRRARAKDACVNGHPFIPENRYYSGTKSTCRICNLTWQHNKRGAVA